MDDSASSVRPVYHCAKHATPWSVAIPATPICRRVRVTVSIDLASAAGPMSTAHAEAVALVCRIVERVGGLVNLVDVTSAWGRRAAQPSHPTRTASGGDDEGGGVKP
jgi:hypothetical protein